MHRSLLFIFAGLTAALTATAQENKDAPPYVPPVPTLTPEQSAKVLKQLEDLEKSILAQRGTSLGAIIQKLRAASATDASAINFVAECEKLVTVERKGGDRKDAMKIDQKKEAEKREPKAGIDADRDGDFGTALRVCLEFLALTLEVRDVKDMSTMVPRITSFHQGLLARGKKLKGRAGDMVMQPIGGGGGGGNGRRGGTPPELRSVIEAYQLDQYLRRENWPTTPGDIVDMYDKVIVQAARDKKKEDMASLWDTGLNTEASFRRLRLADGEFTVWEATGYPNLRWQRAQDLAQNGSNPVTGMAEMLKVIKDYPNHPNSPDWIKQLRDMVTPPPADGSKPAADAGKAATASAQ